MTPITAVIVGLRILFCIAFFTLPRNGLNMKEEELNNEVKTLPLSKLQQIERDSLYLNVDYLNKYCTNLDEFVINNEINSFDLRKLVELNSGELLLGGQGWYPLILQLILELDKLGWDKKVDRIQEKYSRLSFRIDLEYQEDHPINLMISRFQEVSGYVCETCGAKGKMRYYSKI